MDENIDQMKDDIKDTLTCFICQAKVIDPLLCPQCKKMVCTKCIKKWFDENRDICPYCKAPSSLDRMILLPFMNQLSEFFIKEIDNKDKAEKKNNIKEMNKIIEGDDLEDSGSNNIDNDNGHLSRTQIFQNKFSMNDGNIDNDIQKNQFSNIKRGERCPKHNGIIEFYCLNCNTKHCSKCLIIMSEESKIHKDHKIISIGQKNKFKLDEIKEEINGLSNVSDTIKEYKDNVELDKTIIEKKEEFFIKIINEFNSFYKKKSEIIKYDLDIKHQIIQKRLDKINNIRNNNIDSLSNFVERNDENGFNEYREKIKNIKELDALKYPKDFVISLNPNLKFYETDFIDIDINENEETIGEIYFNFEGIEKQLHFKLNGEALDEVLINLQIEADKLGDEKDRYFAYLIFRNKNNNITTIILDEKMVHNEILILGRTIIKSGLKTIVDMQNRCHVKIILAIFNV